MEEQVIVIKFLLVTFENSGVTSLIRASDGMMLASSQANRCAILTNGDPNLTPEMHLFLDAEHSVRYLRENVAQRIAREEAGDRSFVLEFETREGDSRILQPGMGSGRPH